MFFKKKDVTEWQKKWTAGNAERKKMLRQALLELIREKGLKNVSVSDLTERADINRGTFYLHFRDVDDMLEQYQEELLAEVKERTKELDLDQLKRYTDEPYPVIISVLEFIVEQADLLNALFGPQGDPSFLLKWKQFMKARALEKLSETQTDHGERLVPPEYLATLIASAQLGIIQHWLEAGMDLSLEEVASLITNFAVHGPLTTLGLKEQ